MWLLGRVSVRRKFQILGLCLLSVALFLVLALATRDARDTTADLISTGAVRNQGGIIGAFAASGLVSAFNGGRLTLQGADRLLVSVKAVVFNSSLRCDATTSGTLLRE